MDIEITNLPTMNVIFLRHIGPYEESGETWENLYSWANSKGLINENTNYLGLCYDDPKTTPAEELRYDACITVAQEVETEGDIEFKTIEENAYAKAVNKGSYAKLYDVYIEIYENWARETGKSLGVPSIEVYKNDPRTTPEDELITEVYVPIE